MPCNRSEILLGCFRRIARGPRYLVVNEMSLWWVSYDIRWAELAQWLGPLPLPLLAEEFEIKVTALKILSGWVWGTW